MNLPKSLSDILLVVVGCACFAAAIVLFLIPHRIVAGGPPGIAVVVTQLVDITPGIVIAVVNGGLMLLGLRALGMKYLIRTVLAVGLIALLTDAFLFALGDFILTQDRLLNAFCGGVLLGTGLGLIFKGGAASGGWSILARMVADRANIKVGQAAVLLDGSVVLVSAFVFGDYELALLGAITVFMTGQLIDRILSDPRKIQQVYVLSDVAVQLKTMIDAQFGVQGAVLRCDATSTSNDEALLYLSIDHRQLNALKKLIEEEAPDATVTVTNAKGVMGSR